jgi:hypothetical protein
VSWGFESPRAYSTSSQPVHRCRYGWGAYSSWYRSWWRRSSLPRGAVPKRVPGRPLPASESLRSCRVDGYAADTSGATGAANLLDPAPYFREVHSRSTSSRRSGRLDVARNDPLRVLRSHVHPCNHAQQSTGPPSFLASFPARPFRYECFSIPGWPSAAPCPSAPATRLESVCGGSKPARAAPRPDANDEGEGDARRAVVPAHGIRQC